MNQNNEHSQSFVSSSENDSTIIYNPRSQRSLNIAKYETPGTFRLIQTEKLPLSQLNSSNYFNRSPTHSQVYKPTLIRSLNIPPSRQQQASLDKSLNEPSAEHEESILPLSLHKSNMNGGSVSSGQYIKERDPSGSQVTSEEIYYETSAAIQDFDDPNKPFSSVYAINSADDIIVYEDQYLPLSGSAYAEFGDQEWQHEFVETGNFVTYHPSLLQESYLNYVKVNFVPMGQPLLDNSSPLDLSNLNIPRNTFAGPFFSCLEFEKENLTDEAALMAILINEMSKIDNSETAYLYRALLDSNTPDISSLGDKSNWWTNLVNKFTGSFSKNAYMKNYPWAKYIHHDSDDEFINDDSEDLEFDSQKIDYEMTNFSRNTNMQFKEPLRRQSTFVLSSPDDQNVGSSSAVLHNT